MSINNQTLEKLLPLQDKLISELCKHGMKKITYSLYSVPTTVTVPIGGDYQMQGHYAIIEVAKATGGFAGFHDTFDDILLKGERVTLFIRGEITKKLDAAIAEQDKKRFMVFVPENGLAQKKTYSESTVESKIDEGYCETVKSLPHTLECIWKGSNNILTYISGCLVDANRRGGLNQRLTRAIDDGREYYGDACFIGLDDYGDSKYCGLPEYVADRILETLNGIKISERAKVNIGRVCYYAVKDAYDTLKHLKGSDNYKFLSQTIRDEIGTAFGNLEAALCNIDQERATKDLGIND